MKELCDYPRIEPKMATFYLDENLSKVVDLDGDAARIQYGDFMVEYARIRENQAAVWRNFIEIGHSLLYIRENGLYHVVVTGYSSQGYSSFYKFCQEVFGYKKQTVCNLINVAEQFGDESGRLDVTYSVYSFSQLVQLADIDKSLRGRISAKVCCRDIAKLKALYHDYTPKSNTTIDMDLQEWKRRHDEKLADAAKKRNAINFFPAHENVQKSQKSCENEKSVQTCGRSENRSEQTENYVQETIEDVEHSVISTPVMQGVSFDGVRKGLIAQLKLLTEIVPHWGRAAQLIEKALMTERSRLIREDAGEYSPHPLPSVQQWTFRNDAERTAFLDESDSWAVWIEISELDLIWRRVDFLNGDYLLALSRKRYGYNPQTRCSDKIFVWKEFYLCTKEKPLFSEAISPTRVLEYLKAHKAEI